MSEYDYRVLLEDSEFQRMRADGYLEEVVIGHAQERFKDLREEFRWKNSILGRYYAATPFFEFVADVFPDLERFMVITGETTYTEMDVDELMEYQSGRSDVYVTPASFINGCYSASTCRDVYALVVDIDRISPQTLDAIIENGNLGRMTPMPTYIVNSGRGVHFYYVFDEPVPHYNRNQPVLKSMYRMLCGITKQNILAKTDWHAITQPFRLPGSLTRLGQTVTGWKCGDKWSVDMLARRLSVNADAMDLLRRPLLPQWEYKEEKERRAALAEARLAGDAALVAPRKRKKRQKRVWVSSMAGKTGFYMDCLQRCYKKTREGSRYRSLMALTVVARKCTYPKEQLEQDLLQLLDHYNTIGSFMKPAEVKKAIRMYNDKALKTTAQTLEEWFGWEFPRLAEKLKERQQAKGRVVVRSKEDVWRIARAIRDLDYPDGSWRNSTGAPTKEQEIREWRKWNPEGTPKECMKATGISKNTVYKWWKEVK